MGLQRTRELSWARTNLPVGLTYDHRWDKDVLRVASRLWVVDEEQTFTYGVGAMSWVHRWGKLHTEVGAGLLVGRPTEHEFLGRYLEVLVLGYPKVDLWMQF